MLQFQAKLEIIVGNPFVFVPEEILEQIFTEAGRSKGPIPVCGLVNGKEYRQTLVRYSGNWRLYINLQMLKDSPRRIGEILDVTIKFDPSDRSITPHPKFVQALEENKQAQAVFKSLSPSRQKEIIRYISNLKTEKSVDKNVRRAIDFLSGKGRFVGRDKP